MVHEESSLSFTVRFAVFLFVFIPSLTCSLPSADSETFELDSMVVTGAKEERNEKVIEKRELRSHRVVDLAEILSDEMVEATMIRKSVYGNEVALRGFGKCNLRTMLDDTILEGACGSRKDPGLSHVNLLAVDRVEVKMGPFDVRHPGVLGGSINVITRNPREGVHGGALIKGGSYGFFSGGGYATGGNEKVQGLLGYNYSESGQYEDGCGNKLSSFATSPGYNALGADLKAFQKHDVWAKFRASPGQNQALLFSLVYGDAEDILTPRVEFDTASEKTLLFRAEYTLSRLGSLSDELRVSFYRNEIDHEPTQVYRDLPREMMKRNEVISTFYGGRVENVTETGWVTLIYGFDIYSRNWDGEMFFVESGALFNGELVPDVDTTNVGLYAIGERDFDRWSLRAGVRGDRFSSEANKPLPNTVDKLGISANEQTDYLPSGYVSAIYFLTDSVELQGGVGHTVRPPTSVERYLQPPRGADFAGNPELEPTRNTEVDLGFQVRTGRFRVRGDAFYSYLQDFIYQQAPPKTWVNIDAELLGAYGQAFVDLAYDFSLEGAVAYQRGEKKTLPTWNGEVTNENRNLAEIPPLKTRLALHYDTERLFGTFEWIHSEAASRVDIDAGEVELPAWDVFNLRLGYRPRDFITLNFGIDNLFDECYAVANSYEFDVVSGSGANPPIVNEPGRVFYGGLTLIF